MMGSDRDYCRDQQDAMKRSEGIQQVQPNCGH